MSLTVTRDLTKNMRHVVRVRAHEVSTDLAVDAGGEDAGPDPHELYDAALGACKALTMLWYAKRKHIPLEDIQVVVDRDASLERQGTYRLTATLTLSGPLSDAQREELRNVAAKCPIHKLMTAVTTEVDTVLAPGS